MNKCHCFQQLEDEGSNWANLDLDLLAKILSHIDDVVDFICFRMVCKSWRQFSYSYKKRYEAPWHVIPSQEKPGSFSCYLLNPQPQKIKNKYEINLPQTAGYDCIGSSESFLVFVEDNCSIRKLLLLNPLTGAQFPIPPAPIESSLLRKENCSWEICECDYEKAVLSPSLNTMAVIADSIVSHTTVQRTVNYDYFHELAFIRAGATSWTSLHLPAGYRVHDTIFHRGCLYNMDSKGMLAIFDIDNNPPVFPLISHKGLPDQTTVVVMLTESLDGNSLFLLGIEVDDVDSISFKKFQVFKLEETNLEWEKVDRIGEQVAFFVGGNYLKTVSTAEFNYLKGNCIYFTPGSIDTYCSVWTSAAAAAAAVGGVYSLGDETIRPLITEHNQLQEIFQYSSSSVWFTPTII